MPEMGGIEATQIIRDKTSDVINHDIPFVAMTANAMKGDREICLDAGMDDYTSKPLNIMKIFNTMKRLSQSLHESYQVKPGTYLSLGFC
jgi:CheY-like chemotaxis protein